MLRLPRRRNRPPRLRRRLPGSRRVLAAVLLAVGAGIAVDAVAAPAPGRALLVAARDLPAGHRLGAGDLVTVEVPAAAVPDGALDSSGADAAVLAGPVRRGEPVTDAGLAGPGLLAGAPAGTLAVPVRVAEPSALALVGPGDRVAVLAGPDVSGMTGPGAQVVVPSAVVLQVPRAAGPALLGAPEDGGVVVLALDRAGATRVAGATGQRPLLVAALP